MKARLCYQKALYPIFQTDVPRMKWRFRLCFENCEDTGEIPVTNVICKCQGYVPIISGNVFENFSFPLLKDI